MIYYINLYIYHYLGILRMFIVMLFMPTAHQTQVSLIPRILKSKIQV